MHPELTLSTIEPVLRWLNIAGLSVFAVSGALAAARQRLDIIAACFFAIVAATGGGTMRDILIGAPVFWMSDSAPLIICLVVAVAVWLVPLRWWPVRALDWFDAAGLAAYAVYGASKALNFGIAPLPAAAMGIVTACMGGVIRDVVADVPSIMLRNELYVTAAVLAAGLFVGLDAAGIAAPWASLAGAVAGFALRGIAIRWGWPFQGMMDDRPDRDRALTPWISAQQTEPKHADENKIGRQNDVEPVGHDENQDARADGDERLKMRNGDVDIHLFSLQPSRVSRPPFTLPKASCKAPESNGHRIVRPRPDCPTERRRQSPPARSGRLHNGAPMSLVPDEGIEPPTFGLQNRCTTAVLIRRGRIGGRVLLPVHRRRRKGRACGGA